MRLLPLAVLAATIACVSANNALATGSASNACRPIYVRWPRVRVAFGPRREGPFSLTACKSACSAGEDPLSAGRDQPCSGFNQRQGPNQYTHHCQIYEADQLLNVDGFVEADDRYSFYWKYCINSDRTCSGDYAFTFVSDRFMDEREVVRVTYSTSLEQCLASCLGEQSFACRSVSFNRSDGGCHLSDQNQLSKPGLIRLNNNPNFRIDYYENNCFNITDTFAFDYECREDGILIKVESKYPYTGALYGLYDFFTCRIEPREENRFQFLFPSPSESKNCSDSIRYKGNDMILEVVLSTDGVEPLYFITPDDLTYQARCPIRPGSSKYGSSIDFHPTFSESKNDHIDLRQFQASAHALFSLLSNSTDGHFNSSTNNHTEAATNPSTTSVSSSSTASRTPSLTTTSLSSSIAVSTTVPTTVSTARSTTMWNFSQPISSNTQTALKSRRDRITITVHEVDDEQRRRLQLLNQVEGGTTIVPLVAAPSTMPSFSSAHSTTTTTANAPLSTTSSSSHDSNDDQCLTCSPSSRPRTRISFVTGDPADSSSTARQSPPPAMTTKDMFTLPILPPKQQETISTSTITTTTTTSSAAATSSSPASTTLATTTTATTTTEPVTTTTMPPTTSTTTTTTLATTTRKMTETSPSSPSPSSSPPSIITHPDPGESTRKRPPVKEPILFDIFHHGQSVEAVVVGSRITLSFTPYFAISPSHMAIMGCQVEPVASLYDWEREPLTIIQEGCQADNVGLVCPPQRSDFGIRVTVESFRYQSTAQVQYSCLVRVCPFAPCPQMSCDAVEGCAADSGDLLTSRAFAGVFRRRRRQAVSLEAIRAALAANPHLQHQIGITDTTDRTSIATLQQQLLSLGGDHIVKKRLVVVNSEEQLQYYVRTGNVPDG